MKCILANLALYLHSMAHLFSAGRHRPCAFYDERGLKMLMCECGKVYWERS